VNPKCPSEPSRQRGQPTAAASETAFALLDGLWNGPVGLAVLDRGLRFVQVNEPFAEGSGLSAAAHVGRTILEVTEGRDQAARDEAERVEDACRVVVETGRPFLNLTAIGWLPDGRSREWLCSFFPITAPDGSVRGLLAMVSDATYDREREAALARARDDAERSRALLDAVVDNAPIGIGFFDRELRFRGLNQLLADMDGLPVEAHLGKAAREVLPGLPIDEMEGAWREILRTGRPVLDVELAGETPAAPGKRRTWLESWYPVRSGDDILGIGALVREVTAEREADEFQRNVLGIVGHDLRTPLSAIANGAHLLVRADDLPPERIRLAGRILANAARMERIISMLLDYARVRGGHGLPLHRRPCDLASIVDAVADECEAAHPGRQIHRSGSGDPTGRWDPDRIAQVLSNLVSNAVDYSPADTRVDVAWRDEGAQVALEIANEGRPIPPDVLPRLFEPFRRAERHRAGGKDGLGLGLFIASAIVAAHGGTIDARSEDGERTVFTVRLPRDQL
jgi:PAS domain S-box-containing protein